MAFQEMTEEELKANGIQGQNDKDLDVENGIFDKTGWVFISETVSTDSTSFIRKYQSFNNEPIPTIYLISTSVANANGTVLTPQQIANINDVPNKQDILVDNVNIKTYNNQSLLGEGNIVVEQAINGSNVGSENAVSVSAVYNFTILFGQELQALLGDKAEKDLSNVENISQSFINQLGKLINGWAVYFNQDTTEISVPANTQTKLTLTASSSSNENFLPIGVTSLWDSTNSQFDFSSLNVGDMVDIRIDGEIDLQGLNTTYEVSLFAGLGSSGEFNLPFGSGTRFIAGTSIISRFNGIFIGSDNIKNNPAEFRVLADSDCTIRLSDIYVKVIKGGL